MDVVVELTAALQGRVNTDPEVLRACRTDRSGHQAAGNPLALVQATSAEDVQTVCRIAYRTGTPVVSRGAGTGLAGGAIAGDGEIVLSTTSMTDIVEISVANQLAVVEPGILNGEMNRELEKHGLWWPPDPASKEISTVGGNIAVGAGGLLCAKYGVTREAVLALKVVLSDGRLISVGHRTVKGVTGYDLCALMIGSEGTLGIIVEATLKLRPVVTGTIATIAAFFDTVDAAAEAAAAISGAGLQPAVMEILDRRTLGSVSLHTGVDLISRGNAYFLVQCDGPSSETEAQAVCAVLKEAGGRHETTTDPETAARLLEVRRAALPSLEARGTLLIEDVSVPRSQMTAVFAKIAEIERKHGVMIPTTCHAGDGNLHPCFVIDGEGIPAAVWAAADELFSFALDCGGTLTGEHGIGVLKSRWLGQELGTVQLDLQQRIKAVFDPEGLLNPGKVFQSRN